MTPSGGDDYGWLTTPQMIDALGLTKPRRPLILVTEFVGLLSWRRAAAGRWERLRVIGSVGDVRAPVLSGYSQVLPLMIGWMMATRVCRRG
jgi:hypothetical protein